LDRLSVQGFYPPLQAAAENLLAVPATADGAQYEDRSVLSRQAGLALRFGVVRGTVGLDSLSWK
jgi:hypothetical protein